MIKYMTFSDLIWKHFEIIEQSKTKKESYELNKFTIIIEIVEMYKRVNLLANYNAGNNIYKGNDIIFQT